MKKPTIDELLTYSLALFAFAVIFSVTVVEGALFLALIFLLMKRRAEGTLRSVPSELTSHPLFFPWAVYIGVCLLTALTAYYPAKGLGQVNSDFLKYLCLSTLLLTVKKEHLPRLSAAYIGAAAISAFFGVMEAAAGIAAGTPENARAGTLMNPVRYGEVMAIAMSFILPLLASLETRSKAFFFTAAAAALALSALILSQTRGAYLGLAVSMGFLFLMAKSSRLKVFVIFVLLAAGGFALSSANPAIKNRLSAMTDRNPEEKLTNTPSTAINIRLELWKLGWDMFRKHPVVGIGPDNIRRMFKKFHPEPIGYEETWGSLHNLYIHQAAERGILGLGALLLLFLAFFRFALANFRAAPGPYTLWAVCALPAFFVMNITEISFQHVHTSFAIFMAMAFGSAYAAGELRRD